MKWKLTHKEDLINRVDDNGLSTTFSEGTDGWEEYEAWAAAGNTAEEYQTSEELSVIAFGEWENEIKSAYLAAGLTFEYWNEINIEEDQVKIDKYKSDRNQIRLDNPKPG